MPIPDMYRQSPSYIHFTRLNMQPRHSNRQIYFDEQTRTSHKFYIGYIEKHLLLNTDTRVLEIGCGEGGNLLPFAKRGCRVTGIDRAAVRIAQANEFFLQAGHSARFIESDFLCFTPANEKEKYDVVLIHDVIEHIADKEAFVGHLKHFITEKTLVFWGFPAWQMPFGGHQQICQSKCCSTAPFIHLLPTALYRSWLKAAREKDNCIRELMDIKRCRTSIERFEEVVQRNGFSIIDRQLWFINPHYEEKFGLRPRRLYAFVSRLKYIRNFFSTACFYLVRLE